MHREYANNSLEWNNRERQIYAAKGSPTLFELRKGFLSKSEDKDPEQDADAKLGAAFSGVLYQVSLITGCPLSSDDYEIRTLEGHLIKLLMDNAAFRLLSLEDIFTAFRMNAACELGEKVRHFNVFSLDYLGEVLSRYVSLKTKVERKIEAEISMFLPEPSDKLTAEESDKFTREIIQWHYECFLAGGLRTDFLQDYEYNLLDGLNLLQLDPMDKDMLMGLGQERRLQYLAERKKRNRDKKSFADAAIDFERNLATKEEHAAIVREAKRLAVWDFFIDLKLLGIAEVFSVKTAVKK